MDNFKDTIQNVTKTVYKTSKGFFKTTKLSLDLANEESNLKSLYLEVGKKVHEIYAYGGSLGKFFDEKYKEILDCEQNIDLIRRNLDEAKGTRTCPKCGKTAASTSEFCPKCGTRMDDSMENASFTQGYTQPPVYPQPTGTYNPHYQPEHGHAPAYHTEPAYTAPPYPSEPPYTAPPPYFPAAPAEEVYEAADAPIIDTHTEAPVSRAAAKICPVCGKENAAENKFCYSCGRSV